MRRSKAPSLRRSALALALAASAWSCAPRRAAEAVPAPPREPRPVKIALVLGGGGARGFAHVGVIRVLEQEKIPVDLVVGTSAGSLIGAIYAGTGDSFELESAAWTAEKEDVFDWSILGSTRGPVAGKALEDYVGRVIHARSIEDLKVPFLAVATDLKTGEEVILDRGSVAAAVHASSAIPGVFRPVTIDGRTLVDGGVVDPIPAHVARERGADVVIAVDIGREIPEEEPGNFASITLRSLAILGRELGRYRAREADVVIAPKVGDTSVYDFSRKKELMAAGVAATREMVPAIRDAILRASLRPEPLPAHNQ